MSRGRRNTLAGQIAEHLVCAELAKRDLLATAFLWGDRWGKEELGTSKHALDRTSALVFNNFGQFVAKMRQSV
jgi:hypothetical protein